MALVFACATLALADSSKVLKLKKVTSDIVVDGIIDPAWSVADSATGFYQYQPFHGREPSRRTVARVLTTEKALYCLIVCYDKKENIQQNTGKLDDFGGDVVSIMLDTFGDKRTAYKFAVTAAGVRADCRLLDDARNRDYSFDGVWFSDAKVYDWGFVVEMEIPYRSIQYDERLTEWGLDFDRWVPALNEDLYWNPYEENEGQRVSKFGRLVFEDFRPSIKGMNLEIYPVAISKATYLREGIYKGEPDAGIDIFYNPSQSLTFQLTGNPDFAQIEADPFRFNISRYEVYFNERRPFFTQGAEVFMPSGRERNSGFYRPLELFYSRRIGKKLPDGSEVPLLLGTKAFGRLQEWEYGGFLAMTGEKDYNLNGTRQTEQQAYFGSARVKKQILGNSSVGMLFVGKHTKDYDTGVLDIDGAFRASDWQLSYQVARSFMNSDGDFAGSVGMLMFKESMILGVRGRYIGDNFDVNQVGFVPWRGTGELTALGGPRWYFNEGYLKQIFFYIGGVLNYERVDGYTDHMWALGLNMQFRNNWGYEITFIRGRSKDLDVKYSSWELDYSTWFNVHPEWRAGAGGSILKTYNFSRNYLAPYSSTWAEFSWHALKVLDVGTSLNMFVEGNPDNKIEDITYNARPFFSLTPLNDLNIRVYLDNVYVRSTKQVHQVIFGLLFSYSFLPKSWIYLAINEIRDRSPEYDSTGLLLPNRLHVTDRASVLKLKYLYYF
ncbi:MAG: carbohydrate binding family 9 domain-containing protein [Ignavibacteria bacterium]|nr:carbohydrate binding family 9 domain-containing protein [Ignavibacteria bacterium]